MAQNAAEENFEQGVTKLMIVAGVSMAAYLIGSLIFWPSFQFEAGVATGLLTALLLCFI